MTIATSGAPVPAPSGTLRPSIAILVAVTAVNPLALNLYVPSMPSVQATFSAPASLVQLTLSLGLVGTGLIQLAIGPLSDQFGRRPVLLWGLVFAVVASIYCSITPSLNGLIVGRVIQVAGGAAGLVLGRAIVRDLHKPSEAASMLGYVTMGMAMAPMIAPTIGGMLDDFASWRAGFAFTAVFIIIVLAWAWYSLPETNQHIGQSPSIRAMLGDYKLLLGLKSFWVFTMVTAFTGGSFFAFLGGAPYVSRHIFDLGATEYGLYFMLVAIGYSLGNYITGRYASRLGLFRMILGGGLVTLGSCASIVLLSLVGIETPATLFGGMFFLGAGNGMVMPSASAGVVSVLPRLAGSASGLSGAIVTLICALFSYVVAFVLTDSLMPMGLLMTASGLAILVFAIMVPSVLQDADA
ncbi:multidrug effflux MFS transporter [Cohaesibacter celericrescens]|uniref:Bcr/CflA family efflux transporter n=1 Tax=Cohaesibacter celericrescens TaxID=2067669 RepID=A0A2N5XQJ1_9HYPH|nr:multidrug effflux MFS transporter [Cohaesibacter celericrescens]PLW76773.1 MFS transporter permease [Cohaesibacter celericrescens]